jgi:Transposase
LRAASKSINNNVTRSRWRDLLPVFWTDHCLRQAEEGTAISEVCRKAGISEATFFNWRNKYAGLTPSEMKRLPKLIMEPG